LLKKFMCGLKLTFAEMLQDKQRAGWLAAVLLLGTN
jgi:hypothetical protein